MNLEATRVSDVRANKIARVSMMVCFATASVMLATSLSLANGSQQASDARTFVQAGTPLH